ncbi:uncharacterized protein LOC135491739 isoform X2 [Lineus longissimus]|uniref:uncharacterized protein LOC135491739 isoform X2 n=1 Tax=Lineus longissimus TaxID=88925 RepID=UPI00315DBC53
MQKEMMEGINTVDGDKVEKNKTVTEEKVAAQEMMTEENIVDLSLKATRKRRPSKKALESADLEKEVAKSRMPKKPAALSSGLKSDDEMETGHLTRQRSKSPRSTGSRSPRLSRSPRPAKEQVDKPVKKKKVPSDKEKTVVPKAKKTTTSKPKAKKNNLSERNNEINSVALSLVATNSGKKASSSVPMVPIKKRQKKPQEAEGHILLNSKKTKKSAKLLKEVSDVTESRDNKDHMRESEADAVLQKSTEITTSVSDGNIEIENNSKGSELNRLQLETQVFALNGTGFYFTGNHASSETLISTPEEYDTRDHGLKRPTDTSSASATSAVKHSETLKAQNKVVNEGASVEQSLNTCEIVQNDDGPSGVNFDKVEIRPGTAEGMCNTQSDKPNLQAKVPKKKARLKNKLVEGEHVKEKKKIVKKGVDGRKVKGEIWEGPRAKKKRAKNINEDKNGDNTTDGAVVKEKKKRENKTNALKMGGEGIEGTLMKEKKKRVKKTDTGIRVEDGTEVIENTTEGAVVKEKKNREKKTDAVKVEGAGIEGAPMKEKKKRVKKKDTGIRVGELTEGVPVVKEKKKRARKPGAVKVDEEAASLTTKNTRAKSEICSYEGEKVNENEIKIKKGDSEATESVPIKEMENLVKELAEEVEEIYAYRTSMKEKRNKVEKTNDEKVEGVDIQAEVNKAMEIVDRSDVKSKEVVGGGATEGVPRKEKKNSKKKNNEGEGSLVMKKETTNEKVHGDGSEKKRKRKSEDGDGTKQQVMCEKCGFIAGSKAALKKHDVRCHNEDNEDFVRNNPYKCSICEYRAKKLSVIKRHVKKHGLEMCRFCQFVGENKILEMHVRSEHQKMTKCKKCQRRIHNEEEDYDEHVANCQGKHEYKCEICNKTFKYKSVLKVHQITHDASLPKRFSCEHCDYQSHFKANLQKHIESKHSDRQRSIPCPNCEKLFFSKSNLKKHVKNHTNERPHQCPQCWQSFKIAEGLKDHLITHASAELFKCEYENCGRTFKYRRLLKSHLLEFHNELPKKLKCSHDGCELVFFKRSHLRRHESTHSGDRNYLCTWPDCGKAFRHADNLKVHYRQHTNEKPIQCALCEFACRQRNSLSWHMKRHHNPVEATFMKSETVEVKNETSIEGEVALKLAREEDEVSNHSTDSSATIEIDLQTDLSSLAVVAQAPEWRKIPCETANLDDIVEPTDEIKKNINSELKKPRKKKLEKDTDTVNETEPKTERKLRKPFVKRGEVVSEPYPSVVNGASVIDQSEGKVSSQNVSEFISSSEKVIVTTNDVAVCAVLKPKRKRRTREQMAAARAEIAAAKAAAAEAGALPKKRRRRQKDEKTTEPEPTAPPSPPSPPSDGVEVQGDAQREDYVDLSYPYKEKRPPKGKRLLNPDNIKEVTNIEKGKENVYDFDSDDENRVSHQGEQFPNFENTHDMEQDVREIIEKDTGGSGAAASDLPDEAQIFVGQNDEFPDRSDGEIIDRHLLQKYLEDTSMDGFERDLMKEEEKVRASRNQFDNYVSPEAQPVKLDRHFDSYVSPDRKPLSGQPMKGEDQFDNYVSLDRQPLSVQPLKAEGQFESYMSPERRPMSVQPMKPEGQYDKYVSPEHVQVMSNQSVVNHDTMSLPSDASQHGEGQWKGVESNKNTVIGALDTPWTGPNEPQKQVEAEPQIFDLYAPEKGASHASSLSEKYSNHLDSTRDSAAYRIPDYGSMYDTTTRMLASGLSSYPPVCSDSTHSISRSSASFDPKDTLGYSQTPTPYLQSSGLYGANMNPPGNSYIDPRVDPYTTSQLPSHASSLQARDNPLNSLAISASKYIESEINKTRVYNQQGWTLQETQSLRLTHSLFPNRTNDWEASSRPSSTYSYLSDRDMAGYNMCSTTRPPVLSDRLSAGYISGQTVETLEKQAFERYDMANYLNSRHAGIPQPPSFNFDRQMAPLSSSAKAFTDSYRGASSIPDYRGLSHSATAELYTPNLNLDKYFYTRDSMYAPQRGPLPSENLFLSQPSSAAQPSFPPRDYPRGSVYSQPGAYQLMDNGKYSDPGKFAQPISSMQGREFYLPRPGSATCHIQDSYRPPMLYNMMNRYFE